MMTMSNEWYNLIMDRGDDGALDVYILDEIGLWGVSAEDFIRDITENSSRDKEVRVHLNSPGGDVFDGLAIYNFLKDRGNVTTIVDGVAASMASVIFMAGTNRIMPRNSLLMIHNPWGVRAGDSDELRKAAEALDKMQDSLAGIYANATGMGIDAVKALMDETTWMNGADAEKDGFATTVTDEVKMAASFDVDKLKIVPEALARAKEKQEMEMNELETAKAELQETQSKLDKSIKDAEAKTKESFDAGIAAGTEQELGKIKARMDKYKDASFVIETLDLDDSEVKDKHIAKLEAGAEAQAKVIAELSKDDSPEAVQSVAAGSAPEEVTIVAKSAEEITSARVAELKAEGKSAEEAYRTAYAENEK
jgi:ATP-dependent Clp endopeptidase proteolytic subunit ClpP